MSSPCTIPTRSAPPRGPLKTTPCYCRMKELGAVFGSVYGWERPNWFAPKGYEVPKSQLGVGVDVITNHNHAPPLEDGRIVEKWSFRRSNYFEHVGNEVRNVTSNVGLQDMSAFAKMRSVRPRCARVAGIDPGQPHPEEAGPHRALPPADQGTAASAPSSPSTNGQPGTLLSGLGRRL